MNAIATLPDSPVARAAERWHRQIGRRLRLGLPVPRPTVAVEFLVRGSPSPLVSVELLECVVLYDDVREDHHRLRFAAYGAGRVPWGVALGGRENLRFDTDLASPLLSGSQEVRVDADDASRLELGLLLDRRTDRYARRSRRRKRHELRLPPFRAAFRREDAAGLDFDGPELEERVRTTGIPVADLVRIARRMHDGFVTFPLEWVSHRWERFAAIYADLRDVPRKQIVERATIGESLRGFRGACQFDFLAARGE